MGMGDSDGLFDAADLEHVEPVEAGVEVGAGVNKRFRAFEPHAVICSRPSAVWLLSDSARNSKVYGDRIVTKLYGRGRASVSARDPPARAWRVSAFLS